MVRGRSAGGSLRSLDILTLMSPRSLWRMARGIVRAPFEPGYAGSPLAVCWFTNFSCNVRCPFCCKASEIRAGREEFPPLPLDGAKALLERIRASVEMLYLSGGEPLLHPPLEAIVSHAKRLGFTSVGLTSNGILLDRRPGILDHIDAICVSIHSPSPEVHARSLGVPIEIARRAFENLELLNAHPRRDEIDVLVNTVVNETNLDSVLDMIEFTRQRDFLLEIVPANNHGRMPTLARDPRYEALVDRLIEMRRRGEVPHLAGSTGYYQGIRDMVPFRCFPYGVPNVAPDGRLYTPCDVSEQLAVSVLDHPTLKDAVKASLPHLGDYPCREGTCFKAGVYERSRLFGLLGARSK